MYIASTNNDKMNYELVKTETGNKAAKYLYQVVDLNGKVITKRNSNREYVACTIDGFFFFGRLDLIGKGDHGKRLKRDTLGTFIRTEYDPKTGDSGYYDGIPVPHTPIAYLKK